MVEFTKEEALRIIGALYRVDGALSTMKCGNDFQSDFITIEVEESIELMRTKLLNEGKSVLKIHPDANKICQKCRFWECAGALGSFCANDNVSNKKSVKTNCKFFENKDGK